MRKIPWQSRKELHLQLAASCGVYHGLPPWFSMHFRSIATFLAKSANEKNIRSVRRRWHMRSENSASITSPSHWPSSGDVCVRACNVWLPQGPSYSMNAVVHIGKERLYKTSRLSPNSHLFLNRDTTAKRRPAVLSTLRKVWMVSSTGAGIRKLFWKNRSPTKRHAETDTVQNTRDGGSTSKFPFLQTNLFVVTNSTISFQVFFASWSTSSSFSRSLQQRWPLRSGLGSLRTWWSTSTLSWSAPGPGVAVLKSSNCACLKISPSVWGILGDDSTVAPVNEKAHIDLRGLSIQRNMMRMWLSGTGRSRLQRKVADEHAGSGQTEDKFLISEIVERHLS